MENKNSISEVETMLVDVRRAYRLLYVYQQRVLDVMQFIGYMTSRRRYTGWSWFSHSSPRDGKKYLDNWAWDWLNMYLYEFHFGEVVIKDEVQKIENSIKFSVFLVSDSGFYDGGSGDAQNIESFSAVENSTTKLVMLIGKNTWHTDFDDSEDFATNMKKDALEYRRQNDKGILLAKSFNLSSFINADSARESLRHFVSFCQANDIPEMTIIK